MVRIGPMAILVMERLSAALHLRVVLVLVRISMQRHTGLLYEHADPSDDAKYGRKESTANDGNR